VRAGHVRGDYRYDDPQGSRPTGWVRSWPWPGGWPISTLA
jgi:hypothetical protein